MKLIKLGITMCCILSVNGFALDRIDNKRLGDNGKGIFIKKSTGEKMIPRGVNYVRLSHGSKNDEYQSTFAPGKYSVREAESALQGLKSDGYNIVRIFIDPGNWKKYNRNNSIAGNWDKTKGLSSSYMNNVADFITRAYQDDMYVLPILEEFPYNQHYYNIVNRDSNSQHEGYNAWYLDKGHLNAKKQYVKDFVNGLQQRIGREKMKTVFAYALGNEAFFSLKLKPFNKYSGTVQTANNKSYNMRIPSQRQQAADANIVNWVNTLSSTIKQLDSEAMVTLGAFTFNALGRLSPNGLMPDNDAIDKRYPIRPAIVSKYSNLDFIDLHVYPTGRTYSMARDLASSEYSNIYGPVLMGEFGAIKSHYNSNIVIAAYAMKRHQVMSCDYNFAGWLYWTYDTDETADQKRFYNLLERGGAVNGILAPIARPNPCK